MTIEAKIIKDSVGPNGVRLTTYVLKYPRFIHSEFMTHRAFSRNASSSRAIPFEKQMKMIEEDMALPLEFRKNQRGMQAGDALDEQGQFEAETLWRAAGLEAIQRAKALSGLGVHKQYVNRLVEPFAHISVVLTATDFANFFALRHHSMAQPEIAELAKQMWTEYTGSQPQKLEVGHWHLPFVSEEEVNTTFYPDCAPVPHNINWPKLIKMSVARCARVSYLNHDGTKPDFKSDEALYDRLLGQQPIHASPAEHQAQARNTIFIQYPEKDSWHERELTQNEYSGNLRGWKQYRKTLQGENITEFTGPLK